MTNCLQTEGISILDHGKLVHSEWLKLLDSPPECLKPWWTNLITEISFFSREDIELYHIMHDCGKPYCLTIDEKGRRHFPNHAIRSFEVFNNHFNNPLIASWILHDMDIHTISASELERFISLTGSCVLLLTGLAELNANASMFGGKDSLSYKIKYKHWYSRAKAYCKRKYHG